MPRPDTPAERVDVRLWRNMVRGTLPRDLLICGPAGTGKTFGILTWLHCLARDNPGLRILFAREARASLTESVLVTYEQEVLALDGMEWLAAGIKRRVRQSYDYPNGSQIVLGGLDSDTKVLSTAWDIVFINEAIETELALWEGLLTRLKRPGRHRRLGFLIADTNPGSPGHWLKARCDAGLTTLWDTTHEANPALHDGLAWTDAGEDYRGQLDRLTGTRRARLRDGRWVMGEGVWFDQFTDAFVTEAAEYEPELPTYVAADSGVHTAAVWFQVTRGITPHVRVFGDLYLFRRPAREQAREILTRTVELGVKRVDGAWTDPAGDSATATVGPTVMDEWAAEHFRPAPWPRRGVLDGLDLIDSLVSVTPARLSVHPRCQHLINAFGGYTRVQRAGQWIDKPTDPNHPHEDLMDALRGGLVAVLGGVGGAEYGGDILATGGR